MTALEAKKAVQSAAGTVPDGKDGPKTRGAIDRLFATPDASPWPPSDVRTVKASSFADPADVRAFEQCKATGKTDIECFAMGDNGIGQFGAITAQEHTPMCALHANDMTAQWGSVAAAAHKRVRVTAYGKSVVCLVEDRMSSPGRIDLNPAAAKALGLTPPFLADATWEPA